MFANLGPVESIVLILAFCVVVLTLYVARDDIKKAYENF